MALWLALLRPQRVQGLVLVAPALDMPARHWAALGPEGRSRAVRAGCALLPSPYLTTTTTTSTPIHFTSPSLQGSQPPGPQPSTGHGPSPAAMFSEGASGHEGQDSGPAPEPEPQPASEQVPGVMVGLAFFAQAAPYMLLQQPSTLDPPLPTAQASHPLPTANRQDAGQSVPTQAEVIQGCGTAHQPPLGLASLACPVAVLHGDCDDCVPLAISVQLLAQLGGLPEQAVGEAVASMQAHAPMQARPSRVAGNMQASQVLSQQGGEAMGGLACWKEVWGPGAAAGARGQAEQQEQPPPQQCIVDVVACTRPAPSSSGLASSSSRLYVVRGGDHRLSSPAHLQLLDSLLRSVAVS